MGIFDKVLKEVGKAVDSKIGGSEFTDLINTALDKKDEAIYGEASERYEEASVDNRADTTQNTSVTSQADNGGVPRGKVFDYDKPHLNGYVSGKTHEDIKSDDNSAVMRNRLYDGTKLSFSIPVNFLEFDSGALEISDAFLYTPQEVNDDNYEELYETYFGKSASIYVLHMSSAVTLAVDTYQETGDVVTKKGDEYISVWEEVKGSCGEMYFAAKLENKFDKVVYVYCFEEKSKARPNGLALALEYNADIVDTPLEVKLHRIFDIAASSLKQK